jgi:hypothetical protein
LDVPPTEQFIISSWHSVIDEKKGLLYISCTLNPEQKPPKIQTTFFAINIKTGKIQLKHQIDAPIMFLHLLDD